jgi:PPOX class probable FMN-dependent enzyme
MFRDLVTEEKDLRALLGTPSDIALRKQISRLDVHCRAVIAHAPFVVLATAGADGRCDVSPKGDPAGFVRVLDDTHLAIPDRPGNKRLDGMRNILANPHVGLLFLVPARGETLRVNGRACITRDADLLATMAVDGKVPSLAIGVEVEEVFLHCAKAFKRSGLWEPSRWPDLADLCSSAKMFHDQVPTPGMTVEDFQRRLDTGYRTGLY